MGKKNVNELFDTIEKLYKEYSSCKKELIRCTRMTPVQCRALEMIKDNQPCTLMELADKIELTKSRANRIVNTLIDFKYIEKKGNEKDKRSIQLTLTPEGINVYNEQEFLCHHFQSVIEKKYSESEIDRLKKIMEDMILILKKR